MHGNESGLDDIDCQAKTIETIVEPSDLCRLPSSGARMPVQGRTTLHVNTTAIKWVDSGVEAIGSEDIALKTQL